MERYPDLSGEGFHTYSCFHPVQEGDESPAELQAKLEGSAPIDEAVTEPGAQVVYGEVEDTDEVLLDVKEASREYASSGSCFLKRDKGASPPSTVSRSP